MASHPDEPSFGDPDEFDIFDNLPGDPNAPLAHCASGVGSGLPWALGQDPFDEHHENSTLRTIGFSSGITDDHFALFDCLQAPLEVPNHHLQAPRELFLTGRSTDPITTPNEIDLHLPNESAVVSFDGRSALVDEVQLGAFKSQYENTHPVRPLDFVAPSVLQLNNQPDACQPFEPLSDLTVIACLNSRGNQSAVVPALQIPPTSTVPALNEETLFSTPTDVPTDSLQDPLSCSIEDYDIPNPMAEGDLILPEVYSPRTTAFLDDIDRIIASSVSSSIPTISAERHEPIVPLDNSEVEEISGRLVASAAYSHIKRNSAHSTFRLDGSTQRSTSVSFGPMNPPKAYQSKFRVDVPANVKPGDPSNGMEIKPKRYSLLSGVFNS